MGEPHQSFEFHHVGYPRTQGAWNLADATRYRTRDFSLWLSLAEIKHINADTLVKTTGASPCPTHSSVLPSVGATCGRPFPIAKILSLIEFESCAKGSRLKVQPFDTCPAVCFVRVAPLGEPHLIKLSF